MADQYLPKRMLIIPNCWNTVSIFLKNDSFFFLISPHRLRLARTPAFHAGKPGSTPGGVTMPPLWWLDGLSVNTDFVSLNYHRPRSRKHYEKINLIHSRGYVA